MVRGPGRCLLLACLAAAVGVGLAGCAAPSSLYSWGGYEASLSSRYLQEDLPRAELLLRDTIAGAERESRRVPPGAYADYGFLLYRRKDYEGAIRFFEKEKAAFPESAALMTRIVSRVREQQREQPGTPPAAGQP
jgi:hypothetical protein